MLFIIKESRISILIHKISSYTVLQILMDHCRSLWITLCVLLQITISITDNLR